MNGGLPWDARTALGCAQARNIPWTWAWLSWHQLSHHNSATPSTAFTWRATSIRRRPPVVNSGPPPGVCLVFVCAAVAAASVLLRCALGADMPLLRPCAVSALQRPDAPTLRRTSGVLAAARSLARGPCVLPAVLRAAGRTSRRAVAPGSRSGRVEVSAVAGQRTPQAGGMTAQGGACLLTTSITATTVQAALVELQEAEAAGADVVELRLDFLQGFQPGTDLPALLAGTKLPAIVTYRPNWEGGKYAGAEEARLHALWLAVELKAAYVDVELKAAAPFFAASPQGWQRSKSGTRFILSSHNYSETPSVEDLRALHARAIAAGADIVKIATTAQRIVDVARLEALLRQERGKPTIALGMGEAGLVRRSKAALHGMLLNAASIAFGGMRG